MLGIDTNVLVRFLLRDDEAQFQKANKHSGSGESILNANANALIALYHWRYVNCQDFDEGVCCKPLWSNGIELIKAEADEFRGRPLPWNC